MMLMSFDEDDSWILTLDRHCRQLVCKAVFRDKADSCHPCRTVEGMASPLELQRVIALELQKLQMIHLGSSPATP